MIAVTGANGYVGGRIVSRLRAMGIPVVALVRDPKPGDQSARPYALARPLRRQVLDDVDTVVHAAYDLSVRGGEVRAVNFTGSLPLVDAVAERHGRIVLISSLSAFDGARSDYGRAKFELEHAVAGRGGIVLRPGLVFGARAGGLFGAMASALSRRATIPMVGGGWQRLFVTHDEALCELVANAVRGRARPGVPLFAAHEVPTTLRAIGQALAAARGRRLTVIPIPPALLYGGLRAVELSGLALPFRSDSLRSLQAPIPLDQVSALERSEVGFPALSPSLWAG